MKGGMKENPTRRNEAQKFVALHAAFKANPIGHTPPACDPRDAPSVGPVAEDPQHGIGIPDITHSAHCKLATFPRKKP
jgi:hypothetical protein